MREKHKSGILIEALQSVLTNSKLQDIVAELAIYLRKSIMVSDMIRCSPLQWSCSSPAMLEMISALLGCFVSRYGDRGVLRGTH